MICTSTSSAFSHLSRSSLQFSSFQCLLILGVFKLYFCLHNHVMLGNCTILSKILQQGIGKHSDSLLWGFSSSLPALQRELPLVLCRGWEQWSSALHFPKWYLWWRRIMVTYVAEWYSSYVVSSTPYNGCVNQCCLTVCCVGTG